MVWIKRNLFLVLFGLVACGLLAGGVFYLWSNRSQDKAVEAQLDETKQELETILQQEQFPNATNIALSKAQLARVQEAIAAAQKYFSPVPFENVTNQQPFKSLLNKTIDELQQKAEQAGVDLPAKDYAFSFEAQRKQLHPYAPGSFPTLPEQVAELKALCEVLFEAKINKLVNVKRWRITVDDPPGSTDYHESSGNVTNAVTGTVINPYEMTFYCFSGELAAALEGFYKSPYGFTVKTVSVQPVLQTGADQPAPGVPPPPPAGLPPARPLPPRAIPPAGRAPNAPPALGGRDTLQTVIDERLLGVNLRLEVVKPVK